jgi:hypothetical protein
MPSKADLAPSITAFDPSSVVTMAMVMSAFDANSVSQVVRA